MADTVTVPRTKGAERLAAAAKRRAAVVAAYRRLKEVRLVAQEVGLTRQRVWQILNEEGVYHAK